MASDLRAMEAAKLSELQAIDDCVRLVDKLIDGRISEVERSPLDLYTRGIMATSVTGAAGFVVAFATTAGQEPSPDADRFSKALREKRGANAALGVWSWAVATYFVAYNHPRSFAAMIDLAPQAFGAPTPEEQRVVAAATPPLSPSDDDFHRTHITAAFEACVGEQPDPSFVQNAKDVGVSAWNGAGDFVTQQMRKHFPDGPPQR